MYNFVCSFSYLGVIKRMQVGFRCGERFLVYHMFFSTDILVQKNEHHGQVERILYSRQSIGLEFFLFFLLLLPNERRPARGNKWCLSEVNRCFCKAQLAIVHVGNLAHGCLSIGSNILKPLAKLRNELWSKMYCFYTMVQCIACLERKRKNLVNEYWLSVPLFFQ